MRKKYTTTRTTDNGEKVKVYIDNKGNLFVTVIDKDNFTIKNDFVMEVCKNVLH